MSGYRALSHVWRRATTSSLLLSPSLKQRISASLSQFHTSLLDSSYKVHALNQFPLSSSFLQRSRFFSSATPKSNEKKEKNPAEQNGGESAKQGSRKEDELSIGNLVKLMAEKEELLKVKDKHIKEMQDKFLITYAEMENVMDRTRREAENAKKFALQGFAKILLDVSDNLERASSVVKESFSKIDVSHDTAGAAPLLKTLLEGVEMTEKQLLEVFRKYGVVKYKPINEEFDPNRHNAVYQVPDVSKPPGIVASVLKPGYMLHDRVLRAAEVGVTRAVED